MYLNHPFVHSRHSFIRSPGPGPGSGSGSGSGSSELKLELIHEGLELLHRPLLIELQRDPVVEVRPLKAQPSV